MSYPAWIWHFSTYFYYSVPSLTAVHSSLSGLCVTHGGDLCLSRDSWLVLSNGLLDPTSPSDVAAVNAGVILSSSKGIILSILARDVASAIPSLIANAEALAPFFNGRLSVVVFENDSVDGTRDLMRSWAASTGDEYTVDLMSCEGMGSFDCKLHEMHR